MNKPHASFKIIPIVYVNKQADFDVYDDMFRVRANLKHSDATHTYLHSSYLSFLSSSLILC